jgi:hypothetical protein
MLFTRYTIFHSLYFGWNRYAPVRPPRFHCSLYKYLTPSLNDLGVNVIKKKRILFWSMEQTPQQDADIADSGGVPRAALRDQTQSL